MKKIIFSLFPILIAFAVLISAFGISISAEDVSTADAETDDASIPDGILVDYSYLKVFKEQLKQEILAEIAKNGGALTGGSGYGDVTLVEGQMIVLSNDCEVIFRGGNAVAITSACDKGEGIMDISVGNEIFSGMPLEFGHIYHSAESDSKKAVLITGESAHFTLRGSYEIV